MSVRPLSRRRCSNGNCEATDAFGSGVALANGDTDSHPAMTSMMAAWFDRIRAEISAGGARIESSDERDAVPLILRRSFRRLTSGRRELRGASLPARALRRFRSRDE